MTEILQTDSLSLLEIQNFERKIYFLLSILHSISPPILLVDFYQQCFAEMESILKRQFCVEQYSNFSQQKDFGDSILQNMYNLYSGIGRQNSYLWQR